MRRNTLKLLAFSSALALGFATSNQVFAQTETVNATLITSSAITTTDVSDMDFGEWLIQFTAGDTPAITLTSDGSAASTQTGSVANGSQVIQITAPASEGVVNVQTPGPSSLTMTRSNSADFPDAGLALTTTTYRTATEGPNALSADAATGTVTVVAAATDEAINFGGITTITATPADATHAASFDVTLSY